MTSSVFVGNIPYSYKKEDLKRKLSLVGPVKNFDIKQDGNTNPKGFGFCDYENTEIASSALRNLNKIDYNGRQLRIGVPENNKAEVLSEEENLIKKDITYIKESNSANNEISNNNNAINNKNNFQNILLGLSQEQKFLLLYSMKTLSNKNGDGFKKLLSKQSEETLNDIIALQRDVIDNYKNKAKK